MGCCGLFAHVMEECTAQGCNSIELKWGSLNHNVQQVEELPGAEYSVIKLTLIILLTFSIEM